METFMSGFAQGFVRARERSEDRRAEQENTMFKYKMDSLMQQKEKRNKKKLQEQEWGTQAESLAQIMGDGEFSSIAMQELKNGVSYETMQKRISDGFYVKNDTYKPPTQTLKVPTAVSQPVNTNPEQGDTAPYRDPLVSAPNSQAAPTPKLPVPGTPGFADGLKGLRETAQNRRQKQMEEKVNRRIGEIDPTLLTQNDVDAEEESATTTMENSKYIFKPKNEVKIGDYADAQFELLRAQQSKDPIKIRDAQLKVDAHEMVYTRKAKIEAQAKGEDARYYLSVNPDGKIGKRITGVQRNGEFLDISDPRNPQGTEVTGDVVEITEDDMKRLNTLRDNFGKGVIDYNVQSASYVAALDSSQRLTKLLADDPGAPRAATRGLSVLQRLQGELQAGYQMVYDNELELEKRLASNNLEGVETLIAEHKKNVDDLYTKSILTPGNQQRVLNGALYQSLKLSAAYQFAQANANGGKMSNQDFETALTRITGNNDENPDSIIQNLRSVSQEGFVRLSSLQKQLDKDPSIQGFERDLFGESKNQTGLRPMRLGELILSSERDDMSKKELMDYLSNINAAHNDGKLRAQNGLVNRPSGNPEVSGAGLSEEETGLPQVMTKEARDKLQSGTRYIGPDGKERVKK
jgi:hypothetical protein